MITWGNYEEYIMMHADGELQPEEVQALMNFINEHPELKSELALYTAARFIPDETLVYENKQQLLRPQPAKRTLAFPLWQRYSVAAGIAALICISVFKWGTQRGNNNVALSNNNSEHATSPVQAIAPKTNTNNTVAASHSNTMATSTNQGGNTISPKQNKPGNNGTNNTATAIKHIYKEDNKSFVSYDTNKLAKIEMDELPAVAVQKIPVKPSQKETPSLVEVPGFEIVAEDQGHKRSFLDRLHLDEANRNQLKTIGKVFSGTVEKINDTKDNLSDKGITVQINRESVLLTF